MTSQKDFIRIELKAKLLDLRKNYFIDDKEVIKALKDIIHDIEVKQSLESRLGEQD